MGLEVFNFLDSLVVTNPVGATDPKSQGDDHLRGIKVTLTNSFPGIAGAMTLTHTQLNNAAIKNESNAFLAANTFDGDVTVLGGNSLIVQDATNADSLTLAHDGTDFGATFVGTGILALAGLTDAVEIQSGAALRIYDSGGTEFGAISHNGSATLDFTNDNVSGTQVVRFREFNFFHIQDGAALRIYDSGDSDYVQISHDGTDAAFNFVNAVDVEFGRDFAPTANYRFHTNDTDLILYLAPGGVDHAWFRATATTVEVRSLIHGAPVQLLGENAVGVNQTIFQGNPDGAAQLYESGASTFRTADRTAADQISGAQTLDANGDLRPVGLGVLVDDATAWGSGTVTPFQQVNVGQSIEQDNASSTNYDTYANTGSNQTNIPAGAWWFVTNSVANQLLIRGGTGVTIRAFFGDGNAPSDVDVIVDNGGYAVVRKVSDSIYEVYGKGISS